MACIGGAPRRVMVTWYKVPQNLAIYHSLADGLGKACWRPTSIPQECPLSTAWLSMRLEPFMLMRPASGAIPRGLADDT
eukprot:15481080-Alexandrium_andersonii.AAC.1